MCLCIAALVKCGSGIKRNCISTAVAEDIRNASGSNAQLRLPQAGPAASSSNCGRCRTHRGSSHSDIRFVRCACVAALQSCIACVCEKCRAAKGAIAVRSSLGTQRKHNAAQPVFTVLYSMCSTSCTACDSGSEYHDRALRITALRIKKRTCEHVHTYVKMHPIIHSKRS